jgi:hypothetical protein
VAALTLDKEMSEAGFGLAAAYLSLAAKALEPELPSDWGRTPPVLRGDGVELELDEHGRVWLVRDGMCDVIGRRDEVVAEMRRFLDEIAQK